MNGVSTPAHVLEREALLLPHDRARADERAALLLAGTATLLWAVTLFVVARERYADFRFARYDLGNMVQAVWSTAHGRLLEETNGFTGEQMTRLGSHVDPILALLAPFWIVMPSPLTLEAIQILAVALGALPVLWLSRRHLGSERAAVLLVLAYLAYPWIAWTAIDALHPVTLAIPLLLYAVWFLDTDRLALFAGSAVLVATTGELMGIVIAAMGIWYALARNRRSVGAAIAVAGVAWTAFALYVVVPAASGGESVFYGDFHHIGGSPQGIVRTALTDPMRVVSAAFEGRDLVYLFLLGAPLAGLFLLAPGMAALAVPSLAVNLLADDPGTTDPHEHYIAGVIPFLITAVVFAVARQSPSARIRAATLVLVLSLAATATVGPWPGSLLGTAKWDPLPSDAQHIGAIRRAVSLVPETAAVSVTNRIGSHLAARRYFYSVPVLGRARWVVIERADTWIPQPISGRSDPRAVRDFELRIARSPGWERVFDQSGVVVYRRASA